MAAVDALRRRRTQTEPTEPAARAPTAARPRPWARVHWGWALGVTLVLAGSFALRVWGAGHGMPYAYNADENAHFVPKAIGLFGHGWNPHYFVNPPAYTYLLHIVFDVWFGGRDGVSRAYASDPTEVFVVARVTAAATGTLAVWLLYLAGARFFDRRVGLLAAALMGVAFLPVFYSHLALNDVPTLAPICLALWGTAGVLRRGRAIDYLAAGVGVGLACATKYTGGIVLLPLVAAATAQLRAPGGAAPAARGLVLAAVAAALAFFAANPYALLSFSEFREGLTHQTSVADDAAGKLGSTQTSGQLYYLWTFTWGLGVVPAGAAIGAIFVLARDELRLMLVLAPAPIIFTAFMGTQSRFFGRWLIPVFPMVCLLAAYLALEVALQLSQRRPALRPTLMALAVVALCGQGLVYALHEGMVLSRPDTRNEARRWLKDNVPARTKIVVEPVVPDSWAQDVGHPLPQGNGNRWTKYATSRSNRANDGSIIPGEGRIVNIEDYERTLFPGLIDKYEAEGYCYVVTGSTQRGRAEAQPDVVPDAIAYYRELARRGRVVHEESPFHAGADRVGFNFDFSFDYYPLAYERPGAVMTIYRLMGGQCAGP
ncbi:MAG: hypothetical protein QOH43_801 [Solirubrobacteraceae bacterium]|nr:hypothetical protein [Solirubrobacteraceae bacterium]